MAASNDIPWLGLLAADMRGAGAPDAPVCSAAGRDGDAGRNVPTAVPQPSYHWFDFPGCSGEADEPVSAQGNSIFFTEIPHGIGLVCAGTATQPPRDLQGDAWCVGGTSWGFL